MYRSEPLKHLGYGIIQHDDHFLDDSHLSYTTLIISHNYLEKYYRVDSAYQNTLGYLSPYIAKKTRHHIPQFRKYSPPKGVNERFNRRHSSL